MESLSKDQIVERLREVIQELSKNQKFEANEASVEKIVAKFLETYPLHISNLSPELKAYLEQTRTIKLVTPSIPNVNIKVSNLLKEIPMGYKVLDDVVSGNNVWLYGKAGSGKTVLAEIVAKILGLYIFRVNCNQYTSPNEFLGGQTMEGYKEGKLIMAWRGYKSKKGDLKVPNPEKPDELIEAKGCMLLIDEITKLDPNTAGVVNDALAKTGSPKSMSDITNNGGETFYRSDNFACIATANTNGKGESAEYVGNNRQDLSLLDRFAGCFYQVSYNEKLEQSLTFSMIFDIFVRLRKIINDNNINEIVSLRTMLNSNRIYQIEMMRFTGKSPENPEGKTLIDCLDSIFSTYSPDKLRIIMSQFDYDTIKRTYKDKALFERDLDRLGIK